MCRWNQYTMLLGLHVNCPTYLSDFNEIWIVLRDFSKKCPALNFTKPWKWGQWWYIRTDVHEEANGRFSRLNSQTAKDQSITLRFPLFLHNQFFSTVKLLVVFVGEYWLSGGGFCGLPQPIYLDVEFVSRKKPSRRIFAWSLFIISSTALGGPWPPHDLHLVSINQPNIGCCRYTIVSVTDSVKWATVK